MVIHAHALMNSTTHSTPKRWTQKSTHFCVEGSASVKRLATDAASEAAMDSPLPELAARASSMALAALSAYSE